MSTKFIARTQTQTTVTKSKILRKPGSKIEEVEMIVKLTEAQKDRPNVACDDFQLVI